MKSKTIIIYSVCVMILGYCLADKSPGAVVPKEITSTLYGGACTPKVHAICPGGYSSCQNNWVWQSQIGGDPYWGNLATTCKGTNDIIEPVPGGRNFKKAANV
jgi:hypothetical protein